MFDRAFVLSRRAVLFAEALEPRYCLTTFDISGVQAAALDQPQIHAFFRTTANGAPLTATDGGFSSFDVQAFLDTGTSGLLLSQETAQGLGIGSSKFNNQTVTYADVGVAGAELFDVSQQVFTALAPFIPTADVDNPANYNTVYTQKYGPVRTQITRTAADDLIGPLDILGMPLLNGKVMVMDPRPVEQIENMHTFVYDPGTPFNPNAHDTNPGIPTTNRHVKLSYGDFTRFTQVTPSGAAGPSLAANPFIGPNPVRLLDANPAPDTTPPIQLGEGTHTSTGSFLFDTGAGASFMSVAQAANLHVHYKAGTYNTDNPILVDDNGVAVPNQFVIPLGGIGGTLNAAGFFVDSLTLPTTEGQGIRFLNAPLLVADVSVQDPVTKQTLILDGDFGMNFLVASCDVSTGFPTDITAGAFDWAVFDQPGGLLGLQIPGAPSVFTLSLASGNNSVYVKRNADTTHADFWINSATPGQGAPTQQTLIAQTTSFALNAGTGNDTLTIDFSNGNPLPAGGMNYDGGAGANALAVVGTSGNDTLGLGTGGITFTGGTFSNVSITPANVQSVQLRGGGGGNDAVNVTGGTWTVNADTPTGTPNVSVTVAAGGTATFGTAQHLAALTVNGSGKLVTPARATFFIKALTVGASGAFDIGDNFVYVDNTATSTSAIVAALRQAYHLNAFTGFGPWDGAAGITSSTAKQSAASPKPQVTIGYIDGSVQTRRPGLSLGITLPTNRTLIRPALYGDVNLNGVVDGDDIGLIIQLGYFGKSSTTPDGWVTGDLNYDTFVDGDDIGLIIQTGTFSSGASLPPPPPAPDEAFTAPSLSLSVASVLPVSKPVTTATRGRSPRTSSQPVQQSGDAAGARSAALVPPVRTGSGTSDRRRRSRDDLLGF